jgi:hypothetical protein
MNKIIYILGAGRSGTTLLDIVLGNNPGLFSAGELNRYARNDGRPSGVDPASATGIFWHAFRETLAQRLGTGDIGAFRDVVRKHEYHTAVCKILFGREPRPAEAYRRFTGAFLETLARSCPGLVVIDSSKYAMRAYWLARLAPCEVAFVYLKRHPADVVRSFARRGVEQPAKSWLAANLYLLSVHLLSTYLCRRLRKKHTVYTLTYETLVGDPDRALAGLAEALQVDLSACLRKIHAGEDLKPGALFEGNRLRLQAGIRLQPPAPRRAGMADRLAEWLHRSWWP